MLNGRYDRQQRLGDGGMGEVWRAVDLRLGRPVAVKMPLRQLTRDSAFVERFQREARAMASVNHHNVIDIYDVCDSDEGPFIVMEYVDGESLSALLRRRGALSPDETMSIVAQAALALHAAHEKDVVHRDVKPGNLLLRRDDGSVVLTDFGVAQTPTGNVLTRVDQIMGTVTYMAPELFQGASASPLSDIYSLGVVAYQCLAGHPPFHAENDLAVAWMHLEKAPAPLPAEVPPAVRRLVERALAKQPQQRYETAAALAEHAAGAMRQTAARKGSLRKTSARKTAPREPADREPAAPVGRLGAPLAGSAAVGSAAATQIVAGRSRPRRGRLLLAALLAGVVAIGAATAYRYATQDDPAGDKPTAGVPAEFRSFAPGLPFDKCGKDDPGPNQAERWLCDLDDTTLYLIRYQSGAHRDARWRENRQLRPGSGTAANWRSGSATAPGGKPGRYLEFEVNLSAQFGGWHEAIWWDDGPETDAPFALLLRTKTEPDAQRALGRLRAILTDAGYTLPQ
ncbi:serine/threonine-protein kinase [Actinomycetes bacterium KLBMP 9797]